MKFIPLLEDAELDKLSKIKIKKALTSLGLSPISVDVSVPIRKYDYMHPKTAMSFTIKSYTFIIYKSTSETDHKTRGSWYINSAKLDGKNCSVRELPEDKEMWNIEELKNEPHAKYGEIPIDTIEELTAFVKLFY